MPIGVPKVPFRSPGEEDASWVDVYLEEDTKDFYLFINSPGGWVIPGVAIYDTMQFVRPDVHTICMGLAASMGSFILVGGEITKLFFPYFSDQKETVGLLIIDEINIKQRSHRRIFKLLRKEGCSFYEAQTGEFILEAEELLKLRETLTRVYVQRTGKPVWIVSEDMERDVFMSATEAQTHGIVDLVAVE
ncbi:hypothetical protein RND81_O338300 [Saponaria officinalis]|uniref:ATP-dependent Clp protease proteolytic subunit n=1 Tax=Saponaria officinalis TaxID=3572 RepID=A0AAW1GL03_SAPOF